MTNRNRRPISGASWRRRSWPPASFLPLLPQPFPTIPPPPHPPLFRPLTRVSLHSSPKCVSSPPPSLPFSLPIIRHLHLHDPAASLSVASATPAAACPPSSGSKIRAVLPTQAARPAHVPALRRIHAQGRRKPGQLRRHRARHDLLLRRHRVFFYHPGHRMDMRTADLSRSLVHGREDLPCLEVPVML